MIDAVDVQHLFDDALSKGDTRIVALALEALEHGIESDAWACCDRILSTDGLVSEIPNDTIPFRLANEGFDDPIPFRLSPRAAAFFAADAA